MKLRNGAWVMALLLASACSDADMADENNPDTPDPDKSVFFCQVDEDCVFTDLRADIEGCDFCRSYCSSHLVNREEMNLREENMAAFCATATPDPNYFCPETGCPLRLHTARCVENKCVEVGNFE